MKPLIFLWRFFTGHYLDGESREASSWWTSKRRHHRAAWRWGLTVVPLSMFIIYSMSPMVHIRLAGLVVLAMLPVLVRERLRRVPKPPKNVVTEVAVTDRTPAPEVLDAGIEAITETELSALEEVIEAVRPRASRRRQA